MGAYMSEPVTEKHSSDELGTRLSCGASSMQGWRMSQEDAHNCCINFDEDVSLFAVYDGHGGHEVAHYCSKRLPEYIKNTEAYKRGDIKQALVDAFLGFDATLATPEVVNILKDIIGDKTDDGERAAPDSDEDEENINNLRMEAAMPLDQVMAKYKVENKNPDVNNLINESNPSRSNLPSPYLRCKKSRENAACSSSGAGCSTSSSSWIDNDTDVSSSSQPCLTSSSSSNKMSTEAAGSSEADQILDSTTSNGDVPRASQVGSSADSEPVKSSEMPDSSEDIHDEVSPSKVTNSTSALNEAETNGENASKDFEHADSSKNANDNECSSSCTPTENGEAEQQGKISSSRQRKLINLYQNILTRASNEDSDDDDEDDDNENDENFDGQAESDEDGDLENESVEDDEDEDEDEDEDDDDDDEDDDEEDDEDEDICMENNEEPGADSGCTAVVAVLKGNELYVANAGDSRCVLCRNGEALELSLDHKPEDQPEMERIVKAGGKVTADGRVNGGLNLSRALGDHAYKKNRELKPEEQMISALPDIKTATIDPDKDEFMVLACDGIWNFMSSQHVVNFIRTRIQQGQEKLSAICEELFDHCLAPNTLGDGTGCDNMTAIIVRFKPPQAGKSEGSLDVATASKKRPISPISSADATDGNADESKTDENKRFKPETDAC